MHNETDGSLIPMLAESWSISEDFTTWTFKIRKGVQFHKGYGEMTAEDVLFSYDQVANSEKHARATTVNNVWFNEGGSSEILDPYTIAVDTGVPFSDITVFEQMATPRSVAVWMVSKKQTEEIGVEEAGTDIAATGPWEIEEWRTGEFWRLRAVENHWRKTPFFAELWLWEIPEEAARVAGFQTGNLDTFTMALDSLPVVEQVPGAKLMQVSPAGQAGLNFYGQIYVGIGTDQQAPSYDPDLPWVSGNPDFDSPEWDQARKVRLAMSIAIDRQLIVDTLLRGFGQPLVQRDWAGFQHRFPDDMKWDFDPDRAKELLAEAGYPEGFSITLTPAVRGAPSEVEACEAIAQMWADIGLDVDLQRVPYGTLRPTLVGRTKGATCHSVSIRIAPNLGLNNYLSKAVFNYGTMHPLSDDLADRALKAYDPQERMKLEVEAARMLFDNVLGATGLYVFDNAWPVGPKLEPWDSHIKRGDLRQINGYEWIRPRQ
jgi:peptide/nickel transport system substrate-binding protein